MSGHYAVVTTEAVTQTRHWKPDLTPLRLRTHPDYVEALAGHLDRAVSAALRGAGSEVGAHLSSGFDSSTVATTAARILASRGGTVVAYTAAPREGYRKTLPNRLADESALAADIASMHPNMEHVVVRPKRTPLTDLARTSSIYGGPVLNICNEPWYVEINDDAASRGISIMLEGANGNATISETGMLALSELAAAGRIRCWFNIATGLVRRGEAAWTNILWKSFNPLLPDSLYRWLMERRFGRMAAGTNSTPLKDEFLTTVTLEAARDRPHSDRQPRMLSGGWIRPSGNSLTNRLIMLVPSDTGAASKGMLAEWKIDYRDPTADRRLVEFTLRVPVEQFIHGGQPRALLRKVLADRVPAEVLDNGIRGYQSADWHERLNEARQEVDQEVAQIEQFEPAAEIIDVERLKRLLDAWPDPGSELWTGYSATLDYRSCLLRAISAGSFMRQAARNDC
jgi:asparagine synthase (glutamine-hydrolysing)